MTRMRTVTDNLVAGAMLAIGIFYVARMLFSAQRLSGLATFAAAAVAGLGALWLWGGDLLGGLRGEGE